MATPPPNVADIDAEVPRDLQIKILGHLVRDHFTAERTSRELKVSHDTIRSVVLAYGRLPSRLQIALEHLEDAADDDSAVAPSEDVPSNHPTDPHDGEDEDDEAALPAKGPTGMLILARALADALESTSKRIQNRAVKIRDDLEDLKARLEADAEAAARRAEVAKLEEKRAKLAAQIAELKGTTAPGARAAGGAKGKWAAYRTEDGTYPCPGCDRVLPNASGLALHTKAKPDHLEAAP